MKPAGLNARVDELLAMLETDADGDDTESGSTSKRLGRLVESGVIGGPLLEAVQARYDGTTHNRGNRSQHGGHQVATFATTDEHLRHMFDNDLRFFVQIDGSSNPNKPLTKKGGTPFQIPPDGAVLNAEPGSGYPDVRFRLDDFVPGINFDSLQQRCRKGTHGNGKTNKTKVERFPGYHIGYTQGIFRTRYANRYHVAEVWFEENDE